ncbi:MAG: 3-dehydroquinate synthase [Moheibacter sp.]
MVQTPVYFDRIFEKLNEILTEKKPNLIIVLADENTHNLCVPLLLSEIETESQIELVEIPAGESSKNLDIAIQIWETLSEFKADKSSLLINLGGGMVTDFGGFVASVYKRGIQFVNIPTSLLAMTDAAFGGKTGLDMNGIKNLIGVYNFPLATLVHPGFLETLPEREFRSGLAEMLKHGLIYNREHWQKIIEIDQPNPKTIGGLIKDSVNIKLEIVEKDPFEKGLRKILNFGHTVGHAVESESMTTENPLLHGEAIAIGMLVETVLSAENELIGKSELDEIFSNLIRLFGKTKIDELKIPNLIGWMENDKKNSGDRMNFSLIDGIGKSRFDIALSREQISEGIMIYNRLIENY